ncbi:unnamed protein product [Schistosoma turkestanicum]|nr:unnamed protein product [Schistosoma turkestanicum]
MMRSHTGQTSLHEDNRLNKSPLSSSMNISTVSNINATTATPARAPHPTSVTSATATTNTTTATISSSSLINVNTTGVEVIGALITALIEYYLIETSEELQDEVEEAEAEGDHHILLMSSSNNMNNANLTVEKITSRLQSICPSLFANEDAMCAKASECLIQASIIRTNILASLKPENNLINPIQYDNHLTDTTHIDQLISEAITLYSQAGSNINLENAVYRLENCGAWRGAVKLCLLIAQSRDPLNIAVDCLKHGRRPSSEPMNDYDHRLMSHNPNPNNRSKLNRYYAMSELTATEGRYDAYRCMTLCLDHLLHAAQIKSDATYIIEPLNTTTTTATMNNNNNHSMLNKTNQHIDQIHHISEEYQFNIKELSDSMFILNDLNDTSSSSSPHLARSILHIILMDINQSNDILAHFEVFNWLLSNGFTDTVMLLNSAHFEAYLRSRLRQTPDDPNLRCLLWRLLERRGARLEAAQVLEHLAVTPCHQLTLEDRLDFAARAIVAVKALPASQQDLDYLKDLEARLELAQLQQMLINELRQLRKQLFNAQRKQHQGKQTSSVSSSPPPPMMMMITPRPIGGHHTTTTTTDDDDDVLIDEALGQLTHGPLLSVTEMFSDYANRFGLHESKLCLLWASGSQDSALIKAIWHDLLRKLLTTQSLLHVTTTQSPSKRSPTTMFTPYTIGNHNHKSRGNINSTTTHSPSSSPASSPTSPSSSTIQLIELKLHDCLSRLSQRFLNDSTATITLHCSIYFPLIDIISTLEYYAIQHSLNATWVPNILRDSRLTCIASITEAYNELIHSKDSLWCRDEVQERLFIALLTIIEDFLTSTTHATTTNIIHLSLRQRMLQADCILNQITGLLVDLNSDITIPSNDRRDNSSQLSKTKWIESLRSVHDRLQRFIR